MHTSGRASNTINTIPLPVTSADATPSAPTPPRLVTVESDTRFREFRKTEQLEPGTHYKVLYLQKVFNHEYGARIRATFENFKYDLPANFLISLNCYNLDNIDYGPVYMHYVGRSDDVHRTINIKLEGLPYRGDHGVNAVPYTGYIMYTLFV